MTKILSDIFPVILQRLDVKSHDNRRRPYHHDSADMGSFEQQFFAPYPKGKPDQILADLYNLITATRKICRLAKSGCDRARRIVNRAGFICPSPVDYDVMRYLAGIARKCKGRIYPSYNHIAQKIGRSRSAVARSLSRLRSLGFISWVRRRRKVKQSRYGTIFAQSSNAYRIMSPRLPGIFSHAHRSTVQLPMDIIDARNDDSFAAHIMSGERANPALIPILSGVSDERLLDKLISLSAAFERRESKKWIE